MSDDSRSALARYLTGTSDEDEEERVRALLEDDPDLRARLEVYAPIPHDFSTGRNPERILASLLSTSRKDRHAVRRTFRGTRTTRAALGLFVLLAVVVVGRELITNRPGQEFATRPGERKVVELDDGTTVELSVASSLAVTEEFGARTRTVRLEGEAYFSVTPDSSRPFVVETSSTPVRVLGTAFAVTAYSEDSEVSVVVAEGRVAVGRSEHPVRSGQRARAAGDSVVVEPVDLDASLAWRDGRLVFRGTTLIQAARTLERWYGLRVALAPGVDGSSRLDATFHNDTPEEMAHTAAAALGLDVQIDGDRVVFKPSAQ